MILDIGGEGRHDMAWNLNPSRVKTVGRDKGQPIPRLIVARAQAIPLADRSVDRIIVEQSPLTRQALKEIARVIAVDGEIILRHVPPPNFDPHAVAKQTLPGKITMAYCRIRGRVIQETSFRLHCT